MTKLPTELIKGLLPEDSEAVIEAARHLVTPCWHEENRDAIDDYNQRVATHGLFNRGIRRL
jgi:post-segregation antitoxin (ccd killing protein)